MDEGKMSTIKRDDHRTPSSVRFGQFLLVTCAIVVLALAYAPASEAQIIIGPTVSLASLTNTGGDVVVGDKDFSDFSISGDFSASQINVTSITINGNFGIRFSGAMVSGGSALDLILG